MAKTLSAVDFMTVTNKPLKREMRNFCVKLIMITMTNFYKLSIFTLTSKILVMMKNSR